MASGIFSTLYYNANTYASPTWTLLDHISSVQLKRSRNWGNTTIRKNLGAVTGRANLLEIEVSGKLLIPDIEAVDTDADYTAMDGFWNANSVKEWLILTAASNVNGARGVRTFGQILTFDEDQSDDAELYIDFSIKPCNVPQAILAVTASARAMQWAKVVTDSLQYSAINANSFS